MDESQKSDLMRAGMARIWRDSLPRIRAQLDELEQFNASLLAGVESDEQRRAAEREAHRLNGLAGTFGFHEATRIARELESMLQTDARRDVTRVGELVAALRRILDTETLPDPAAPSRNT